MSGRTHRLYSLAAVAVAAVLLGMVLAGALKATPGSVAERSAEVAPPLPAPSAAAPFAPPDLSALAAGVAASVVSVLGTEVDEAEGGRGEGPGSPFQHYFGAPDPTEGEPEMRRSSGSGFFISGDGEVLTNDHVIAGADRLEIELQDRSRYEVEVVGRDPVTDLALLKVIKPDRAFPGLALGRSDAVRVGEWVMAVGNPLSMDHTVTVGVVSAKGRVLGLSDDRAFESFIQTDAAINLGSSGGPLVSLRGEVIAVNTAVNLRGQNLGFAIPISTAVRILPQLRSTGRVVRGYLGVVVRDVDARRQAAFGLPSRTGAFVEEVVAGHAGAAAGLEPGDVVLAVDGAAVKDTRALVDEVSSRSPGSRVALEIVRNGARMTVTVELEEREAAGAEANAD